jgi:hypothetical protein
MEIVLGQYRGELVLLGEATSHQPVALWEPLTISTTMFRSEGRGRRRRGTAKSWVTAWAGVALNRCGRASLTPAPAPAGTPRRASSSAFRRHYGTPRRLAPRIKFLAGIIKPQCLIAPN